MVSGAGLRAAWVRRERHRMGFTVREMRRLSLAFQEYSGSLAMYPPPPITAQSAPVSWEAAKAALPECPPRPEVPVSWAHPYVRSIFSTSPVPFLDGWGHPIFASASADRKHYSIVSLGSDGQRDVSCAYVWPLRESWRDLILIDGSFVSAPESWTH